MLFRVFITCIFFSTPLFSFSFSDPQSGIVLEIPDVYHFNERECEPYSEENTTSWWYEFRDEGDNSLSLEIEKYSDAPSLPEHFHNTLTVSDDEEDDESKKLIFEGLEFRKFELGGIEFTKCKLRILAMGDDRLVEPMTFCDYLFVHGQYGFTLSFIQRNEDGPPMEELMKQLLTSLHFPTK